MKVIPIVPGLIFRSRRLLLLAFLLIPLATHAQRQMENLDRGIVAVRTGAETSFISWRVLGLDAPTTGFNLYRSTNGGPPVRINDTPLMVSNFVDSAAPVSGAITDRATGCIGMDGGSPFFPLPALAV